jgi:hypothetical protein
MAISVACTRKHFAEVLPSADNRPTRHTVTDHRLMLARREIDADDDIVVCSELA